MPALTEKVLLLSSNLLQNNKALSDASSNWTEVIDSAFKLTDQWDSIDGRMVSCLCFSCVFAIDAF